MSNIKVQSNNSGGQSPGSYYRTNEAHVDINDDESLKKWATNLDLSIKDLKHAIEQYGPVVSNIRRGLLSQKKAS